MPQMKNTVSAILLMSLSALVGFLFVDLSTSHSDKSASQNTPDKVTLKFAEFIDGLDLQPNALTMGTISGVRLSFNYSPSNYSGEFTLTEVDSNGHRLRTLQSFTWVPQSLNEVISPNLRHVERTLSRSFYSIGIHRIQIVAPGAEHENSSKSYAIAVLPKGSFHQQDMANVVVWRGSKIVADELIVQLKSSEDLKLAMQLAKSVGMRVVGYASEVGFWTFAFPDKGSAAKIEKAYKILKGHPQVLNVEPDYVGHGS